jgi:hypothetical protein
MKHFMNRSVLFLIGIISIASVVFSSLAQAETLLQSSLFSRIYLAFSVDEKAAQAWLPAPWKVISVPKGPFQGANVMVLFDDNFIMQDGEGKQFLGGSFCFAAIVSFAKHEQTGEFATFVNRIYWPYDDPSSYKNAVKATVFRGATAQGANLGGKASEVWRVQDSAGGTLEFLMDYQRAVPKRAKREIKARSSVDPNIIFIYRDDYADDLVKSIPAGIDRVKNYKFRVTMSELIKMFDGSEQLVAISVNPSRVRQKFGP